MATGGGWTAGKGAVTGADVCEDIEGGAKARRDLKGTNLFENLGEPIQKIIMQLEEDGKETDEKTLKLLGHITVKQLAKIFDMLGQGEDPETILAWLKRRARKNRKKSEPDKDALKEKIKTNAERDPIAYFKELERANQEIIKENQEKQEERDVLRAAKAKEREKKRDLQGEKFAEAKKVFEDDGQWYKPEQALKPKDRAAINNAFEKFAGDNSAFDNENKDQDGEWWKKDPYRRDWERHKGKGKKWTGVMEGSKEPATDAELAVREEFYKSNDWWKADRYKQDWDGTKDAEWWKEEPYIKDWAANKHEGTRWRAADEESGLEGEAATYPALPEEMKRREDWYKANGPRGVVKRWNAATEGDVEKCSVPEKHEREEYYRNGDWWKGDDARMDFKDNALDCDALTYAKPADAQDKDWWKTEPYREDFWKKGPEGKKWTALNENAGIDGTGDKEPAPDAEKERREQWYKDNWWKAEPYKKDWKLNGDKGKKWVAPNQKEADSKDPEKHVGPEERRKREEWYKEQSPEEEWWKDPKYVEDYHEKGPDGDGWMAKTKASAEALKGQDDPATPEEQKKREQWYKDNWWKQPKMVEDFYKNDGAAAAPGSAAWTCKAEEQAHDKDWWKQPEFIQNWSETMKPKSAPDGQEWWKAPEYIENYWRKGPKGDKWLAEKETDGIAGKGEDRPADADEQKKREEWYGPNWWKCPTFANDWATNAGTGEKWQAASMDAATDPKRGKSKEPCSPEERREREQYYRPQGDMWRAIGEPEGFEKQAEEFPCPPTEALKRDEWYRNNWWKAPEYYDDWKQNGPDGKKWTGGNEGAGKAGEGDKDPCSEEEKKHRDNWYKNQGDNEWWKEPAYIQDWAANGDKAKMWPADTRPNAQRYGADEHPADPDEKKKREDWYKDNWWKTPAAADDWKKRGKDGDLWTREEPPNADARDPETEGENWWKNPAYIEDWLKDGPNAKGWTAIDPEAAATGQGKKKPASDPEKEKREQWYKDNWWKAPSCQDDWSKNGKDGKDWKGADPEATKNHEADQKPCTPEEQKKREDWYKDRGDKDDWWKRPEFIEDFHGNGPDGKKWNAANPTAGALAQGHEMPASGPEKDKREQWYKDNWWKQPKYAQEWKKGGDGWAKEEPGSLKEVSKPDQKKREDWFKKNAGTPADEEEKAKRDDWYKKHAGENKPEKLAEREAWFKKQLPDEDKKKRMEWLKERAPKDKRILDDELPDALAAINEGVQPSEEQVQAVRDNIKKNREAARDDWAKEGKEPDPEEEETVGQDEFLRAVADTNFYIAPDKEELEMQAEEAKEEQEMAEIARQEEEAAFLKMEKEEELKNTPEEWQKKATEDIKDKDDWWKRPEFIENFQKTEGDPEAATAAWSKDPKTKETVDPEELAKREQWMKDNWWKAPEYSQQWRRDDMGDEGNGDGWKKSAKPPPVDPDAEDEDARPEEGMEEASPEEIKERENWFKNARSPERHFQDPDAKKDEWWKKPEYIEAYQNGDEACFRPNEDDPLEEVAELPPEEKAAREQWMKDNWWKAPKHIEEFKEKEKAREDWAKTAQPGEEPPDSMARPGEDAPTYMQSAPPEEPKEEEEAEEAMARPAEDPISPEEAAEREAWFKKAVESAAAPEKAPPPKQAAWDRKAGEPEWTGEKFIDESVPKQANWGKAAAAPLPEEAEDEPREATAPAEAPAEAEDEAPAEPKEEEAPPEPKTSEWSKSAKEDPPPDPEDPPFIGERFDEPDSEPEEEDEDFEGMKFYPEEEELPTMEAFEEPAAREAEEDEEEDFFGEKFAKGGGVPEPMVKGADGWSKFENEDDAPEDEEPEFDGEKFPDDMLDEDPREVDGDEEMEQAPDDPKDEVDEEAAWAAGDSDDSDGEEDDDEESSEEDDNEHKDDSDLEKDLEAELGDDEPGWYFDSDDEC